MTNLGVLILFKTEQGWKDDSWDDSRKIIRHLICFGNCTTGDNDHVENNISASGNGHLQVFMKIVYILGTVNSAQLFFLSKGLMISLALTISRVTETYRKRLVTCAIADEVCKREPTSFQIIQ